MNLVNIPRVDNTQPGLSVTLYVACMGDIDTSAFPGMDTAGNVFENMIRTDPSQSITFLDPLTQGFATIEASIPNKNTWEETLEGDKGSKGNQASLTVILKGTSAQVRGFRDYVKNKELCILFKDKCGGPTLMLGEPCSEALIEESTTTSGATAGDSRETSITFMATTSIKEYTGTINLLP